MDGGADPSNTEGSDATVPTIRPPKWRLIAYASRHSVVRSCGSLVRRWIDRICRCAGGSLCSSDRRLDRVEHEGLGRHFVDSGIRARLLTADDDIRFLANVEHAGQHPLAAIAALAPGHSPECHEHRIL